MLWLVLITLAVALIVTLFIYKRPVYGYGTNEYQQPPAPAPQPIADVNKLLTAGTDIEAQRGQAVRGEASS
jgi:hypothetical protein